jgi:NDP-sugar pyrophosphorylase family protein
MKAMILAAGLGTRLRPLTDHCPKPLVPFMLQPMLTHVFGYLRQHNIRDVVVNVHHHAAQMGRWLGDGRRWGLHLAVSFEEDILGTAGALKRAATLLGEAPFWVLNADVLTTIDLQALWQWHRARPDALVTMVVRPDPAARTYGAVVVDAADRVQHINGRPAHHASAAGDETIFTGVQVLDPAVLADIPSAGVVSTTADVYPELVRHQAVYGYRHTGYWIDIGVPERYLQAHWDILDGHLGSAWERSLPTGSRVLRHPAATPPETRAARLIPPVVLGPGVTLAPGAEVGPYAVLGAGCQVAAGAVIQKSVLGERSAIGAGARVSQCILGPAVRLPADSDWADKVQCVTPTAR